MFEHPTYIVLEVPEPCAGRLRELRRIHDPPRSEMDVEITIAGSSGVGTVAGGQELGKVCGLLSAAVKKMSPFRASFGPPGRFPGTGIFYFSLHEKESFAAAHKLLAESGIIFNPIPYPFLPHCTLKLAASPPSPEEEAKLLSLSPPCGDFMLDTLSMYSISPSSQQMIFRAALGSGN